jgi:hypothetical protein
MSLVLQSSGGGQITIQEPTTASNFTQDLPAVTGNVVIDSATQTLTNKSIAATQLTGTIAAARLPAGSVLQVVSVTKTDAFTSSATGAFTDITNMSASITPTSSSSKILVLASATCSGQSSVSGSIIRLVRGSTAIDVGDAAGSRSPATTNAYQLDSGQSECISINFLDSPATTSSTTYKLQFRIEGGTFYFNRSQSDGDNGGVGRFASTITLMEIAA